MKKFLLVLILGLVSATAWSNDLDELEQILGVEADVKITLGPGMLGLANMFTQDEPEAQAILAGLNDLSVTVYRLTEEVNDLDLGDWMQETVRNLSQNGIEEIVKVAEGNERVSILAKVNGTLLSDLSIMVYQPGDEFVFIRMDGDIDVTNLKSLTGNFDIDIDGLQAINLN